jgi:hypothetical protein
MEGENHGTVPLAAEDVAMANKIACLLRRELHLGSAMIVNLDGNVQLANTEAVRDILTLEDKDDWLALLEGDFAGRKRELTSGYFDSLWCGLCKGQDWKPADHEQRCDREPSEDPLHNSPFHH